MGYFIVGILLFHCCESWRSRVENYPLCQCHDLSSFQKYIYICSTSQKLTGTVYWCVYICYVHSYFLHVSKNAMATKILKWFFFFFFYEKVKQKASVRRRQKESLKYTPISRVPAGEHGEVSVVSEGFPGDVVLLWDQTHRLHALLQTQHAVERPPHDAHTDTTKD